MGTFREIRGGKLVETDEPCRHPTGFYYGFSFINRYTQFDMYMECKAWCVEMFGADDPSGRWFEHDCRFWFRSESSAILFKVRWL